MRNWFKEAWRALSQRAWPQYAPKIGSVIDRADAVCMVFVHLARNLLWIIGWLIIATAIIVTAFIFPGFALLILLIFIVGKMTRLL